jgi:hypothetical protein
MNQIFWIAFTALCGVGLVVMLPFMICEMGREANRDAVEK